jgi:hypothetical protein
MGVPVLLSSSRPGKPVMVQGRAPRFVSVIMSSAKPPAPLWRTTVTARSAAVQVAVCWVVVGAVEVVAEVAGVVGAVVVAARVVGVGVVAGAAAWWVEPQEAMATVAATAVAAVRHREGMRPVLGAVGVG